MTEERANRLNAVIEKRQFNFTVVLENVFDPHNISAVMRTCDAVGIQDIHVLNTKIPRHKKWGFRSSSGAKKWLTVHQYDNLDDCFGKLRKTYQNIFATSLKDKSLDLYEMNFTGSIALVFGNEHSGVSEEVLERSDGFFKIPQVGIIKSLNISVACAVCLYEAFRQKKFAGHYAANMVDESCKTWLQRQWGVKE